MRGKMGPVGRQFNRNAATYDAHAHVQRMMSIQLADSLQCLKERDSKVNILEIGCGTGALTEMLAKEWHDAKITALDIAPEMIKLARKRVFSGDRVSFLHADAEIWGADAPSAMYDIIVSNACFQWLSRPEQTFSHFRRMLRPGGLLVFTTFGPATFYELHQAFEEVYRARGMEPQRHGLSFKSGDQWISLLKEAGFSGVQSERTLHVETYASVRGFLYSIKAMGASTSGAAAASGLSMRRLFASMYKEYETKFSVPGGVTASYDLLLMLASADDADGK
ncbi:malonyl-CoA O-methyltransferase [Paenibacillaceae bacterium GAS479]|nr:malonyl-CoA O-methyltransferase [Paenibacillaceae bacterium GAS479]